MGERTRGRFMRDRRSGGGGLTLLNDWREDLFGYSGKLQCSWDVDFIVQCREGVTLYILGRYVSQTGYGVFLGDFG